LAARLLSGAIYLLSGLIGILAFLHPFWSRTLPAGAGYFLGAEEAPFILTVLVGLCLAALLVEVQGQTVSAKVVATLGVLVAMTSVLRFAEVALPGPGGFSPIFAPIILAGYVFGARFGLMMGAFTLLVSALVTGGVGPWLPYQMFAAGWVGLSAGWLGRLIGSWGARRVLVILALFGLAWGLVYGAVMNIYFWPFAVGPADMAWRPGGGLADAVGRYAVFYVATSLWWDALRGLGTAALLLVLGQPALRALRRFRDRFQFESAAGDPFPASSGRGR
jgi:energy-coupling factor transport system substrate-specific component